MEQTPQLGAVHVTVTDSQIDVQWMSARAPRAGQSSPPVPLGVPRAMCSGTAPASAPSPGATPGGHHSPQSPSGVGTAAQLALGHELLLSQPRECPTGENTKNLLWYKRKPHWFWITAPPGVRFGVGSMDRGVPGAGTGQWPPGAPSVTALTIPDPPCSLGTGSVGEYGQGSSCLPKILPLFPDRQHQLTLEILISFLKPGSLACDSDNDKAICHVTDPFTWFIYNLIVSSIWSNMSELKPFALKITHLSPFIPCIVAGIAWKFNWCQPKPAVWLITK